jgi:hypothetical protein
MSVPYCPRCRTEYIEGTARCDDCRVALVDLLSEEAEDERRDAGLAVVWTAPNEIEAQMVRALLAGSRIECVLSGEALRLTHGITVDGLAEVRILVRREEAKRAAEVIAAYRQGRLGG